MVVSGAPIPNLSVSGLFWTLSLRRLNRVLTKPVKNLHPHIAIRLELLAVPCLRKDVLLPLCTLLSSRLNRDVVACLVCLLFALFARGTSLAP